MYFYVADGNNTITKINIIGYNTIWYNFTNLKSQNFTFIIDCKDYTEMIFRFIDNTNEININSNNFDVFRIYSFESNRINNIENAPQPLNFNIEEVHKTIITMFKGKSYNNIYDGDSLMNYCINDENGCEYIDGKDKVILEKGKKYKIKLNRYYYGGNYFLYFEIFTIIFKEIEYAPLKFSFDESVLYYFYIINIKNLKKIYFRLDYSPFSYKLINEDEKNNVFDDFEDNKKTGDRGQYIEVENNTDYLILRIPYNTYLD